MLNKILLKKIKFPLSLRGAFSFCYSRLSAVLACLRAYLSACVHAQAGESGNPSSLSLRGAKQRSNLKGFSLIELMVAVAILGIAALGIFQAYTTSFQAMADSKDRTVATNIAQKKLEEVKNSVSVAYPYYSEEKQELNGKTFTIIVAINPVKDNDNLEQVIVTVSWKNRNGIPKNVQLETLIYDLKIEYNVPGPDVGRIALSANPTALTCCVATETSTITAEIFDKSVPEQRVLSGTPVSFSVNNGNVDPEFAVTDSIGKAYTALTINGLGPAKEVRASSGGVYSDFLEVTCTPEADKIDLSANPSAILPGSSSTITATVTDTCGSVISEIVTIEFTTTNGILNNTSVATVNGIATVNLSMSMESSGVTATVTGKVTPVPAEGDPISGSTTVLCTDYSISVTANPTSINPGGDNDTSTITAVLTQSGGSIPIGEISFTTDKGTFENELTTIKTGTTDGKATVSLSSLLGGDIATITATYNIPTNGSISDNTTVKCTEYKINITAEPNKIIQGRHSTITATLTNYLGAPASNRRVDFYTTKGVLKDTSMYTNSSGIATTTLTLSNVGEVANVSASFGYTSDSVNVECIEFILVLNALPTSITPGGSSEITATLKNYSGALQAGKTINFTTDNGSLTTATANTDANGKAIVHLTLNTSGTTAVVTATTYGAAEATVSVRCSKTFITNLSNISFWSYYNDPTDYSIRFDLFLHGEPLLINKVKIKWNTISGRPSRYRYIWIEIPPGSNRTRIYSYSGNISNNDVTVTLNPYTIPANRNFRILINFIAPIRNRDIVFTLNPDDPHAENYQVEIHTPN